jgi:hypothetical protein
MQAEIKIKNGNVMARGIQTDLWIRSPDRIRAAHGKVMKIAHWINPEDMLSVYVMDSIRMHMLYNEDDCDENEFYGCKNSDSESRIVSYDQCVVLMCSLSNILRISLLGDTGSLLSGSNIFGISYSNPFHLCMGTNYDPTNLSPVETLIHNRANRDLEWIGEKLEGQWIDEVFHIKTWPTTSDIQWTLPPQIKENIDAWSRC